MAVLDKRGLSIPLPGNLGVERARVVRHVKSNEPKRMVRISPQRSSPPSPGDFPQRWWRVDFGDGSFKWFMVDGRVVVGE